MPLLSKFRNLIGVGAVGLLLVGCVPVETYQAERLKADQLAEQLAHSQMESQSAIAQRDAAQRQLQMVNNNGGAQGSMIANLNNTISDLEKQNEAWQTKYNDIYAQLGSLAPAAGAPMLDEKLDSQLKQFAAQNPETIEFDSSRGMVKFKSDVTFAVGDATVTAKAKEVLTRFASILNSSGADGYELLVAGHTDSTPVTSKNSFAHGHFNNWYLSAHRAIAVGDVLIADGVNSKRMGMLGYADKRPIASNTTESGKAMMEFLGPNDQTPDRDRRLQRFARKLE